MSVIDAHQTELQAQALFATRVAEYRHLVERAQKQGREAVVLCPCGDGYIFSVEFRKDSSLIAYMIQEDDFIPSGLQAGTYLHGILTENGIGLYQSHGS